MTANERPPPPRQAATALILSGPIARADIPALCRCLREMLEGSRTELIVCDVGALAEPDAVTLDALARLQLTAQRFGSSLRLHRACGELRGLLALTGLTDILPCGEASGLEPRRQAEEREEGGGVQEEADPGDPTA